MTAGHYWHLVGKGQEYHTLEMDGTALHNEDVSCVQCQLCPYWETPPGRGVTDFGSSLFLRLSVLVAVVLADYKFNFSMDSVRYPMYLKKQNKTKQILILSYWFDLDHFLTTEPIPLIILGHSQQLCMRHERCSHMATTKFELIQRQLTKFDVLSNTLYLLYSEREKIYA